MYQHTIVVTVLCHAAKLLFNVYTHSHTPDEDLETHEDYEYIHEFEGDYDYAAVPNRSKLEGILILIIITKGISLYLLKTWVNL